MVLLSLMAIATVAKVAHAGDCDYGAYACASDGYCHEGYEGYGSQALDVCCGSNTYEWEGELCHERNACGTYYGVVDSSYCGY